MHFAFSTPLHSSKSQRDDSCSWRQCMSFIPTLIRSIARRTVAISPPRALSKKLELKMVDQIKLTFLGTAAGKPCATRNVSSIALRLDGTMFVLFPFRSSQAVKYRSEPCWSAD